MVNWIVMSDDEKLNKLMQNPQVKALMKQIIGKINQSKQKYNRRLSDDTEMLQKLKAELNAVLVDLQAKNDGQE
ncbi:MAG: hypothetical protein IJT14_04360 [Rickettsiales bacterium]|nr:hypothetical protein [Rickettsiales bacterium]